MKLSVSFRVMFYKDKLSALMFVLGVSVEKL